MEQTITCETRPTLSKALAGCWGDFGCSLLSALLPPQSYYFPSCACFVMQEACAPAELASTCGFTQLSFKLEGPPHTSRYSHTDDPAHQGPHKPAAGLTPATLTRGPLCRCPRGGSGCNSSVGAFSHTQDLSFDGRSVETHAHFLHMTTLFSPNHLFSE